MKITPKDNEIIKVLNAVESACIKCFTIYKNLGFTRRDVYPRLFRSVLDECLCHEFNSRIIDKATLVYAVHPIIDGMEFTLCAVHEFNNPPSKKVDQFQAAQYDLFEDIEESNKGKLFGEIVFELDIETGRPCLVKLASRTGLFDTIILHQGVFPINILDNVPNNTFVAPVHPDTSDFAPAVQTEEKNETK